MSEGRNHTRIKYLFDKNRTYKFEKVDKIYVINGNRLNIKNKYWA